MCKNQELYWHFEVIVKLLQLQIVQICQKDPETSYSSYRSNIIVTEAIIILI